MPDVTYLARISKSDLGPETRVKRAEYDWFNPQYPALEVWLECGHKYTVSLKEIDPLQPLKKAYNCVLCKIVHDEQLRLGLREED